MGIFDTFLSRLFDAPQTTTLKDSAFKTFSLSSFAAPRLEFTATKAGLLAAAKSNVWAWNCINARARAVASVPIRLMRGDDVVEEHPALTLLDKVNAYNADANSFKRQIEMQLAIYGRALIYKIKNSRGEPVELYMLPYQYVDVIPSSTNFIDGYKWIPDGRVLAKDAVIDVWYGSAEGDPTSADSPTESALSSINRYNLADTSQAAIDKRGGAKGGIVVHPDNMLATDFERLAEAWDARRSDPSRAGRDMHVPHGTVYIADAFSAADMQREQRMERLRKEIMAAYGVPPAVAGDYSDASVLANAKAQVTQFWSLFVIDELALLCEALTNQLLPDYADTDDMYFAADFSRVSALREDADSLAERAVLLHNSELATLNEARELIGLPPIASRVADQLTAIDASKAVYRPVIDAVGMNALVNNELKRIAKVVRHGVVNGKRAAADNPIAVFDDGSSEYLRLLELSDAEA